MKTKAQRVSDWADRKPIIGLMGEFSSGKSSLVNLILGENLIPTQTTSTSLPPIWLSYGSRPGYFVTAGGERVTCDADELNQTPRDARFVRLYLEYDALKDKSIIDVPGISDPSFASNPWRGVISLAHGIVWCTSATQAWRQTEKATWESFPERFHKTSILVATRMDKIPNEDDREKVARRLRNETEDVFSKHVCLSTKRAIKSRKDGSAKWIESGGEEFFDALDSTTRSINTARAKVFARFETEDKTIRSVRRARFISRPRPWNINGRTLSEIQSIRTDLELDADVAGDSIVRPSTDLKPQEDATSSSEIENSEQFYQSTSDQNTEYSDDLIADDAAEADASELDAAKSNLFQTLENETAPHDVLVWRRVVKSATADEELNPELAKIISLVDQYLVAISNNKKHTLDEG